LRLFLAAGGAPLTPPSSLSDDDVAGEADARPRPPVDLRPPPEGVVVLRRFFAAAPDGVAEGVAAVPAEN
jgi:hypothetical protein